MHLYFVTRGSRRLQRRFLEELQDVYLDFTNKKTKKHIGAIQIMPREIKTFECVFPATAKKEIKRIIKEIGKDKVSVHFGPYKKDKFFDGV